MDKHKLEMGVGVMLGFIPRQSLLCHDCMKNLSPHNSDYVYLKNFYKTYEDLVNSQKDKFNFSNAICFD